VVRVKAGPYITAPGLRIRDEGRELTVPLRGQIVRWLGDIHNSTPTRTTCRSFGRPKLDWRCCRALSVAVLIVTLCRLGAVHVAVGVVLSATFWVHIYEEPVADAHQTARRNGQPPLAAASRRRPALGERETRQNIRSAWVGRS